MKTKVKITVSEINKINVISEEVLYPKKSSLEKFYDSISNFLSNGKSFAPAELKSFR